MKQISISEKKEDYLYAVKISDHRVSPKNIFMMVLEFEDDIKDPKSVKKSIERWDGANGEHSMRFVSFKSKK